MGQPEFQTIVASAPRKKLVQFTQASVANIAASGGNEFFYFYAPAGSVCHLLSFMFNVGAVGGGTTGTQEFYMSFDNPVIDIMSAKDVPADALNFDYSQWLGANVTFNPNSIDGMIAALNSVWFDDVTPLRLYYLNNTNAAQAFQRDYRLWCMQETVQG